MLKVSNKIKKYAILEFDHHINQSLSMNIPSNIQLKQTSITEDPDIKLRQTHPKFIYTQSKRDGQNRSSQHSQLKSVKQSQIFTQDLSNLFRSSKQFKNHIPKQRSDHNGRSKFKRFILLTNYNKQVSQNNLIQHKIDRLRKNKEQEIINNQNARALFYSPEKSKSHHKAVNSNSLHLKKNQTNFRRERQNGSGYVPIGYNGQILEKKVSKVSELDKYKTHFINMQISVLPNNQCEQTNSKQNSIVKQYNMELKARQRKPYHILNRKNEQNASFKAPIKKPSQQQVKVQFQRKLQNFINKNQNQKVQLTLRELRQFKQILYRRRQQQFFLAQKQINVDKQGKHQQGLAIKKQEIGTMKETIKKQQVNIQNLKNYVDLISLQPSQQFTNKTKRKNGQKKKNIEVTFNTTRSKQKYSMNQTEGVINVKNKTARRTFNQHGQVLQMHKTHIL